MTRNEVLSYYAEEDGTIRSPGKFEGEMLYVPALWDMILDGWSDPEDCGCDCDCDCDPVDTVTVDDDFATEFPEVGTTRRFRLREDGNGFVYCEDVE